MITAFRLASMGYFGGDPEKVLDASVEIVVGLTDYVEFQRVYDETYVELNRNDNS